MTLSRRRFLKGGTAAVAAASMEAQAQTGPSPAPMSASKPNIVIFTLDDCDAGSLGCFGSKVRDITPNLDRLASEGMRFTRAYTSSSTCQPSRLALMTGNRPGTNRLWGHSDPLPQGAVTLPHVLRRHGYFTAIIGKQQHYPPQEAFDWSRSKDKLGNFLSADTWDDTSDGYQSMWRAPEGFHSGVREIVAEAAGQPFFLHINTSDPHRPWPGSLDEVAYLQELTARHLKQHVLSETTAQKARLRQVLLPLRPFRRNYSPLEIEIPGYLPDLPGVRVDLAQYFSAVHNADTALGRILDALRTAEVLDNTVVIVLSDQGASFPMSKQALYPHGLNMGLVIRWPGVTKPGTTTDAMVSIVDLFPTLLDLLNIQFARKIDGRSVAPLLRGEQMAAPAPMLIEYTYARPGLQVFPMRGLLTSQHLYIFNAWSGAKLPDKQLIKYRGHIDPLTGLAWRSMIDAAERDPALHERIAFIERRTPHELYDLAKDSWCLTNLAGNPQYGDLLKQKQAALKLELETRNDPILPKFLGTGPIPMSWLRAASAPHADEHKPK